MQDKKQQLGPEMEQCTRSKVGKEYLKALYCHSAYLTSIQSTPCKMPGQMNHNLGIKTARGNISNLRYTDDTTLMAECEEELIESLDESEKGE